MVTFGPETFGLVVGFGVPLLVVAGILVLWNVNIRKSRFKGPALTGTARVVSLEGTSIGTGASLVCKFGLSVTIPGRAPYDVALRWPVQLVNIPRVQPGADLPVKVDSADLQKVKIIF
jgi:hypothetical protein